MNPDTGQIRMEEKLTPKQRETFRPIPPEYFETVKAMSRRERRAWCRANGFPMWAKPGDSQRVQA